MVSLILHFSSKNVMRLPLYKNGISWYYNLYHGKGGFAMAVDKKGTKQIAANKKAWHDYFVEEKYEAGIELAGTEVKSIRLGQINLKDSYCSRTVRFSCAACTFRRTKRATSSIRTRCACVSCSCTSARSSTCSARPSRTAIRSFRWRFISKARA